jgi:hypothetical protein
MGTAVIATENRTFLAVRMSHTGRAVVSSMELRSKDGRLVGAVQQESLVLRARV